ncbi:hypothetical protein EJ078_10840 [Mesorhizobium sp. M1A.F.Ca.IN.022.06.1.1]|uniref:hypothetical protein n=1 Tax=Mesorhizobium sp. M1A.F.Ca.IN.022.06.1.1 TaxID=2493680 RepID=UPI000F757BE5|nr:hypothetical protein [Mesorhizobium sp. M1A.F.Ca.IN.022.06.1.1]AZO59675.1 hypothetical protein EJ078_10840 [Mesorhizobium sp. M1A.F.Ca.IN.022.06.1.1]
MINFNRQTIIPAVTLALASCMSSAHAATDPATASGDFVWSGWPLAILTAIGTAALTTGGTVAVTYYGHRWTVVRDTEEERERHATYVAARVVCMLDPFVLRCVDVIHDQGEYVDDELIPQVDAPGLEFPADLDWKTLDAALMYRTLSLPNEIAVADSTIVAFAQHSGPPNWDEVWEERRYQYGRVGLCALDLAADLRRRYGLAPPDHSRWDPRDTLDIAFTNEDVRRKKASESVKNMIANADRKKAAAQSDPL